MHNNIRKYNIGGASMWSPYNTPSNPIVNVQSTLSKQIPSLQNTINSVNTQTNNLLGSYADSGDLFSEKLLFNRDTTKALNEVNNISGIQDNVVKNTPKNLNNAMSIAGNIADFSSSLIPNKPKSATTQALDSGYDATANAIMAVPGWGTIVGGAMKLGGLASDALTAAGVGTSQLTWKDKLLDSKWMKLTPLGLANSIGAKKGNEMKKDTELFTSLGGGYSGTESFIDKTAEGNGKYGLVSRKELNEHNKNTAKGNLYQAQLGLINQENQLAQAGANNPLISYRNELRQSGGYQQNYMPLGKQGLKLDREFAKKVVKLSKDKVPEFKNGGTVNVIPDGALHKNKHHLENIDEKFEDVTTKGIPVITESKGGDITQHAEVEREEIIFNLDVTKQLEKLMEIGSDEAAIEAGKLLVHEILENTVDNTGLLNKID